MDPHVRLRFPPPAGLTISGEQPTTFLNVTDGCLISLFHGLRTSRWCLCAPARCPAVFFRVHAVCPRVQGEGGEGGGAYLVDRLHTSLYLVSHLVQVDAQSEMVHSDPTWTSRSGIRGQGLPCPGRV